MNIPFAQNSPHSRLAALQRLLALFATQRQAERPTINNTWPENHTNHTTKTVLIGNDDNNNGISTNNSTQNTNTCIHGVPFRRVTCSNNYKCKIGLCSNKYPCKKLYEKTECGCTRKYQSTDFNNEKITYISMQNIALERHSLEAPPSASIENNLTLKLIKGERHPDFHYVIAVEWCYVPHEGHYGKGDVVFANTPWRADQYHVLFEDKWKHIAMKVLIVEVKGIGDTQRREKRRKVEEQIESSMEAWRKKRPMDEIWGCMYTDENVWYEGIRKYDSVTLKPTISLDLVPSSAWENIGPEMPLDLWMSLLQYTRKGTTSNANCASGRKPTITILDDWCSMTGGLPEETKIFKLNSLQNWYSWDFSSYVGIVMIVPIIYGALWKEGTRR